MWIYWPLKKKGSSHDTVNQFIETNLPVYFHLYRLAAYLDKARRHYMYEGLSLSQQIYKKKIFFISMHLSWVVCVRYFNLVK